MEDLIGRQLGSYKIVAQLGIGGMATVFKAYQPKMDRYVALKVLPRYFSKNPEFVRRFSREARVIAQLEHPHILPVYDYGESGGYTYLAMRLVEGGSLIETLNKTGKLELPQINRIISQVGGALDYAHKKGVIHRDFKPGNVLVDKFENCLLTDFGIAKLVETTSHLTHTGGILGTPTYISPEQGSGKPIDSRSDIYSLGVVLYQMAVGEVPYKADTPMAVIYKHIHDPLPLPRHRVPDLPESVERVILKALAKDPDNRFQTSTELVNALQNAIEELSRGPIPVAQLPVGKLDPTPVVRHERIDETELPTEPYAKPAPVEIKSIRKTKLLWILSSVNILVLLGLIAWGLVDKWQEKSVSPPQGVAPVTAALYVDTDPKDAQVGFLDSDLVFQQGMKLKSGRYHVEVSANGYETKDTWVDFDAKKGRRLDVQLSPMTAALFVDTDPKDAQVRFLDSDLVFQQGMKLKSGRYHVEVSANGYETKDTWVDFDAKKGRRMDVQLKPVAASIDKSISSPNTPYQMAVFPWRLKGSAGTFFSLVVYTIVDELAKDDIIIKSSFYKLSGLRYSKHIEKINESNFNENYWKRLSESNFLKTPNDMDLICKIGKELKADGVLICDYGVSGDGSINVYADYIRIFLIDIKTQKLFSISQDHSSSVIHGNFKNDIKSLSSKIVKDYTGWISSSQSK